MLYFCLICVCLELIMFIVNMFFSLCIFNLVRPRVMLNKLEWILINLLAEIEVQKENNH